MDGRAVSHAGSLIITVSDDLSLQIFVGFAMTQAYRGKFVKKDWFSIIESTS